MRLWGGRFGEENDARVADFTRSIEVDAELALDDLRGSVAHVRGLGRAGILTDDEVAMLVAGLDGLRATSRRARSRGTRASRTSTSTSRRRSSARVGPVAGKLHTGRSRNDQVATDLRLWLRRAIDRLDAALLDMERALVELAERDGEAVLPGMTHIQPAQPVFLAHHLLAYVEMLERDRGRLADARRRANVSPLGSGALAGAGYPLDREGVAAELGFDGVTANSLDAVSDRDFVVEALAAAALGMVHLSRLGRGDHLVVEPAVRVRPGRRRVLDRQLDDAEQAEPRSGRARPRPDRRRDRGADGGAGAAQGPAAGLPARPPGGQAAPVRGGRDAGRPRSASWPGSSPPWPSTASGCASAAGEGYTTATAVADALVRRGVPFRTAHHVVGSLVAQAEAEGLGLDDVPDAMIGLALGAAGDETARALAEEPGIGDQIRAAASVEGALEAADVIGGTAPGRVAAALAAAKARLAEG